MVLTLKFNIMGILFMAVAIWLGTSIGSGLAGMVGFGGGILGALVVGFVVYLIWAFLSGVPIKLLSGVIFAVLVWIAQMIMGLVGGRLGLGGGILGLILTAVILSFLWGWFGGRGAGTIAPAKAHRKSKRRKR